MAFWSLQSSNTRTRVIILVGVTVCTLQFASAGATQNRRSFIKGCGIFLAGIGVGVIGTRKFDERKTADASLAEKRKTPETHKNIEKPKTPESNKVPQNATVAESTKARAPESTATGYWKSLANGTRDSVLPDFAAKYLPENLYAKTAVEALSITLGVDLPYATAIYQLRKLMGKGFLFGGNAGLGSDEGIAREIMLSVPKAFYLGVVKGPLIEELLYRGLPGAISKSWWMGVPSSLAFGFQHNFYPERGKLKFSRTIPVPQIYGGLYFWWLQRQRGIAHSILAHSTQNLTLPAALLYYKVRKQLRKE